MAKSEDGDGDEVCTGNLDKSKQVIEVFGVEHRGREQQDCSVAQWVILMNKSVTNTLVPCRRLDMDLSYGQGPLAGSD